MLHQRCRGPTWRQLCRAFRAFSDDAARANKSIVMDFTEKHHAASAVVKHIQQVLNSTPEQEQLRKLREAANQESLWENATQAASILQQLSALEKRHALAAHLDEKLDETKDLFDLAMDESDQHVLDDCMQAIQEAETSAKSLHAELLLSDPTDSSSCFVEIHAGAGGTESGDWVEMLLRMYTRWAERHPDGFHAELVHAAPGEEAGYRSVCLQINGSYAYGWLKTEAGVHRLVRISPFDSASRRHTSFAQVRVFPLAVATPGTPTVEISPKDLRVDTYRASGPGGQHVNKTESAIRITHLPTKIVVQCQSDRSQHRNKDTAMEMLRARLLQQKMTEQDQARRQYTQDLGDNAWGSQIRSYVLHPYKMVKDHRTNVSTHDTKGVLDGDISTFIQQALLASTKPSIE
ncbi:hypothetical protein Ae201684P_015212 [Aphanomyces euteiches]|nr:hypothetical protein Ae201684P_015212 [Aphanomyces euteiches]